MTTRATTTKAPTARTPAKCTFCDAPAAPSDTTDPPACGAHGDLLILTEWMAGKGEPLTAEAVAAHVARARTTSDFWTIQPDEVAGLLPAVLEARRVSV